MNGSVRNIIPMIVVFVLIKVFTHYENKTKLMGYRKKCVRQSIYLRDALVVTFMVSLYEPSWFMGQINVFSTSFPASMFVIPAIALGTYLLALIQYRIPSGELE